MSNSRASWKKVLPTAAAAAMMLTATMAAAPAQAEEKPPATLTVIASGLKNPRGITAQSDGSVLVAESGEGLPGCAAGTRCLGATGAIVKVPFGGSMSRVVTGLPSVAVGTADPTTVNASGPAQAVRSTTGGYTVLAAFGGPGTPQLRTSLGGSAKTLGTVFRTGDGKVLGDMVTHEATLNPDGGDINGNPWRFVQDGSGFLATDAGANDVVAGPGDGTTSTKYVLPKNGTAESVPTGIVKDSDGTLYIADMGGGQVGGSRIWKVPPGQQPQVLVSGLTNIVDIALDWKGDLLALSYSSSSLAGAPTAGSLSEIDLSTKKVTTVPTGDRLKQPSGIVVDTYGGVYITNHSVGTKGQLVRIWY
ncbi:ScyD/ScyE family protein [Streptomyces azureus]|uniref:NHL repeat containing protein n=1 Tax=Streptomyces azureus TaxID=146537 RepID=A0A0K8PXV6_STRAJ|nr:ScyD/ScyE family protein [Streptomyces azureus]GAP52737.1 NHL repeat containing protein [Streptomyces azureus]